MIGWVGSFRSFHAVEQLIAAAPSTPDTVVLLVGDGPERRRIEQLAREAGVTAMFTGTVPHHELPEYLAAMDVGRRARIGVAAVSLLALEGRRVSRRGRAGGRA